jgi:hypothetical protein
MLMTTLGADCVAFSMGVPRSSFRYLPAAMMSVGAWSTCPILPLGLMVSLGSPLATPAIL